jgi:hypothetical protein
MAMTKIHDVEVCVEDGVLKLIPYKLYLNTNGDLSAQTDEAGLGPIFTCKLSDKRNRDLVAYVLDSEHWDEMRDYWDGYSDWQESGNLQLGVTPARITKWAKSLPEYELTL